MGCGASAGVKEGQAAGNEDKYRESSPKTEPKVGTKTDRSAAKPDGALVSGLQPVPVQPVPASSPKPGGGHPSTVETEELDLSRKESISRLTSEPGSIVATVRLKYHVIRARITNGIDDDVDQFTDEIVESFPALKEKDIRRMCKWIDDHIAFSRMQWIPLPLDSFYFPDAPPLLTIPAGGEVERGAATGAAAPPAITTAPPAPVAEGHAITGQGDKAQPQSNDSLLSPLRRQRAGSAAEPSTDGDEPRTDLVDFKRRLSTSSRIDSAGNSMRMSSGAASDVSVGSPAATPTERTTQKRRSFSAEDAPPQNGAREAA